MATYIYHSFELRLWIGDGGLGDPLDLVSQLSTVAYRLSQNNKTFGNREPVNQTSYIQRTLLVE